MAIKFIDILEPVNPAASAIAKTTQIAGARSVETAADLNNIIPQVLSASYNPADGSHGNDAIGQVWYVASEDKYYKLTNFSVDTSTKPFSIDTEWEIFIDSSITSSAIDNRIITKLATGIDTQTIFGYNTKTNQHINTNAIYMGGYADEIDGITITSNGKSFEFPSVGGTLATTSDITSSVEPIRNELLNEVSDLGNALHEEVVNLTSDAVKFKNIDAANIVENISNESIASSSTKANRIATSNVSDLPTLLADFEDFDTIKLKTLKQFSKSDSATKNINVASVSFCNGGTNSDGSYITNKLPKGWMSYGDKPNTIGPTNLTGQDNTVYEYKDGYLVVKVNWKQSILEGDIANIERSQPTYTQNFEYIDTSTQTVTFDFIVKSNENNQTLFYITTAGVDNDIHYSLGIGNSYDSNQYIAIGYSNTEIGINSNPKDFATFQVEAPQTGDRVLLTEYANSYSYDEGRSDINYLGILKYNVTIGNGKLKCVVNNLSTNQSYTFNEIEIPNFKFRYFGFMNDAVYNNSGVGNVAITMESVPVYAQIFYTTNSDQTVYNYLGCSNNYVKTDGTGEIIWNFDDLIIPTNAESLQTRFTTSKNEFSEANVSSIDLETYYTSAPGFGLTRYSAPSNIISGETGVTVYGMSIFDSANIGVYQNLYAGPDNRTILLSAEDYVKFDRPIVTQYIKSVNADNIGGSINVPYIENGKTDTLALISDINSTKSEINLQTVCDNQSGATVILNNILTIVKSPVENVHSTFMMGDFSSRIGSNNASTGFSGFSNETIPNGDGTFSISNRIHGAPLTLNVEGSADEHATTVGQVNRMISSAMSNLGAGTEMRYVISNPDINIITDGYITWSNVLTWKNSEGVTGIDYTNVPCVQVYDKTTGMVCYPDVKLSTGVSNNQNYTIINIIFKSESDPIPANKYVAVVVTSAEVA